MKKASSGMALEAANGTGKYAQDEVQQNSVDKSTGLMFIAFISVILFAIFIVSVIGGFLSEGINSVFFLIIGIVASVALGMAAVCAIRMHCGQTNYDDVDVRATFTRSRSEDDDDEDNRDNEHRMVPHPTQYYDEENGQYYNTNNPGFVADDEDEGRTIEQKPTNEISATSASQSIFGEMSALSPRSFEMDRYRGQLSQEESRTPSAVGRNDRYAQKDGSISTRENWRKGPFDFASTVAGRTTKHSDTSNSKSNSRRREDPPDVAGDRRFSHDPSARHFTTHGTIEEEESTSSNSSVTMNSITDGRSMITTEGNMQHGRRDPTEAKPIEKKTISDFNTKDAKPTPPPPPPPPPPPAPVSVPTPPTSTRNSRMVPPSPMSRAERAAFTPTSSAMTEPSPKHSEVGSTVSSLFLKPFNKVFGRRKSGSGASETPKGSQVNFTFPSDTPKNGAAGKPPKSFGASSQANNSNNSSRQLDTISGPSRKSNSKPSGMSQRMGEFDPDKAFQGAPSPHAASTYAASEFSMPASEFSMVPSEFRSSAGVSDVASSTYDPQLHALAVQKSKRDGKSLGVVPVSNDKRDFFEEEKRAEEAAAAKKREQEERRRKREQEEIEAERQRIRLAEEEANRAAEAERRRAQQHEEEQRRHKQEVEQRNLQSELEQRLQQQAELNRQKAAKQAAAVDPTPSVNERRQTFEKAQQPQPPTHDVIDSFNTTNANANTNANDKMRSRNNQRGVDAESDVPGSDFSEFNLNRVGVYDVFAPPGPIGIVVDSTPKGPVVHSLKRSSPMTGLIAPGDRILALDEHDVRRLNAAQVTKLMAKKSQQRERKITLVPNTDLY